MSKRSKKPTPTRIAEEANDRPNKVLVIDLEVSPTTSYVWSLWNTNSVGVVKQWYILSVAWQWLHEANVKVLGLDDFPATYKKNSEDDSKLVQKVAICSMRPTSSSARPL